MLTYNRPAALWQRFEDSFGKVWQAWQNAYWVDDLYGMTIVQPGKKLAETAAFRFDIPIVDGLVNGAGRAVREVAGWARGLQSGLVRSYSLVFGAGTVAVIAWILARGA